MKKVANKIAFIIFALLAVLFTIFAAMNYNSTKNTILDVSKNSKEAIARSLEVYVDEYLSSKVYAVEGLMRYIEENPPYTGERVNIAADRRNIFRTDTRGHNAFRGEVLPETSNF